MKTYAKLIKLNTLEVLQSVPYILNPSEETLELYAKANGYKELIHTDNPGIYYKKEYIENSDTIAETWVSWAIDDAKNDALTRVQMSLDAIRNNRVTIPCDGIEAGIFCDQDARMMATGLVAMGNNIPEGMTWTDANDNVHELTPELLAAISKAFVTYLLEAQHKADNIRTTIKTATDITTIEDALSNLK